MSFSMRQWFGVGALCASLLSPAWPQAETAPAANMIGNIVVVDDTTGLADSIHELLQSMQGQPDSAQQEEAARARAIQELGAHGYLEATVAVTHDAPRAEGGRSVNDLQVTVTPGRQYRISSITAGGGPLLPSRDFSPGFAARPGDIAGEGAFGRVPADLRAYYWRYGYADVETHVSRELDRKQATVGLRLDVIPGPVYHLHSVNIQNLGPEQESKVQALLGLKAGDVFDQTAVTTLYHKVATEPSLAGYGFTFTPKEDKTAAMVDLNLDFYKKQPTAGGIFR
jgi:outer membrane protein assembly factor BamA